MNFCDGERVEEEMFFMGDPREDGNAHVPTISLSPPNPKPSGKPSTGEVASFPFRRFNSFISKLAKGWKYGELVPIKATETKPP